MAAEVSVGALAPDFDLPADGGRRIELSAMRGRKVVLYFYPKDDTSGCTRQAIDFSALKGAFQAAGAAIIGISPDSVEKHNKFRDKHGLEIALASDTDRQTLEAYGVWTQKSMYGRKYMGVERTTVLICEDGRILRIWRNVKVPGHAEEVLSAIREA